MPWVVGYDEGWSEEDFHSSNKGKAKSIHLFCEKLLFKIWIASNLLIRNNSGTCNTQLLEPPHPPFNNPL